MSKGRLALLLVAIGSAAFFWRRRHRSRDRIDLYYADGSMISLAPDAPDTQELFSLATDIAGAAKPS
ncbi:MAG: DLW-39 family protein [Gaiellaceae bacterium]